jgi:hypothetical protein
MGASTIARQEPIRLPEAPVARVALVATAIAFAVLFAQPFANTTATWWDDPEAGHGLLLVPLALYLAWRRGLDPDVTPNGALGLGILSIAVALVMWRHWPPIRSCRDRPCSSPSRRW